MKKEFEEDMSFYSVMHIDECTWRIEDCFKCYMYLLEGEEQAVLIDSGIGMPGLKECVDELTQKPVTVITSHGHLDHVGGNCQFKNRYMMEEDHAVLKEHTDVDFRRDMIKGFLQEFGLQFGENELDEIAQAGKMVPYLPLKDRQIFDLGKRTLEIIATPGHTKGSICVLDKERKNLFSGDMVCDQGILLFLPHAASVSDFLHSIQWLKEQKNSFEKIWPGHHKYPLDLDYLEEYEECAKQILKNPQAGEDISTNLGKGKMWKKGRISITYRPENL